MAIYYLRVKSFGRSAGRSGSRSTSAAAYRAGERIRDERTGAVYDHSHRQDILHKEIVLPARISPGLTDFKWARNRESLWNSAELAERRSDARVAREYTLALPHELSHQQRVKLARSFAQHISDRYQNAVDLILHAPRNDPRNFHAHLLTTTRELTPEGLGRKTSIELSGSERFQRGLPRAAEEWQSLRERWGASVNEALKEAGLKERVSHLSPVREGSERAPVLPAITRHIEQRGGRSYVAERIRAERQAQLAQDRAKGPRSWARRLAGLIMGHGHKETEAVRGQAVPNSEAYRARSANKAVERETQQSVRNREAHPSKVAAREGESAAEQSLRNWPAYRAKVAEKGDAPTAEQSLGNWPARRAKQEQERVNGNEPRPERHEPDPASKRQHDRSHGLGL